MLDQYIYRSALSPFTHHRVWAAFSLASAFVAVEDTSKAWKILHRLTRDSDRDVRKAAAEALRSTFHLIPENAKAWNDLDRLTRDEDRYVRLVTAVAIGSNFNFISEKLMAWEDLDRLTRDIDSDVRQAAAIAIGSNFSLIPEKTKACEDLRQLTLDDDRSVRATSYHSLAKVSIYDATKSEEEIVFKKRLEDAIGFFERSSQESFEHDISSFCLPFYRSFYAISFNKEISEAEIVRYLEQARIACEGSKSRNMLINAVEALSRALLIVQKMPGSDLRTLKWDLDTFKKYCDKASDLLIATEEKAPGATRTIQRAMPIISKKIKEIIGEIEDLALEFCKASKNTKYKKLGRSTCEQVAWLKDVSSPVEVDIIFNSLLPYLREICADLPENSKNFWHRKLDNFLEGDLVSKGYITAGILVTIKLQIINWREKLNENEKLIEYLKELIIRKMDNIQFEIFKMKIAQGNIISNLNTVQSELNKLCEIDNDLNSLNLSLDDLEKLRDNSLQDLNKDLKAILLTIREEIRKLPSSKNIDLINKKLDNLEQSKDWEQLAHLSDISSVIGLTITVLQSCTYLAGKILAK